MAEELAAAHMRELGFGDARRTGAGTDRGIDVTAADAVAQVKHLSSPVGSPDIQRFRGAAHLIQNALFYSSSGYTRAAQLTADELGVALFRFDSANYVESVNYAADVVVSPPPPQPPRERTPEEKAEDELAADVRVVRFRAWAWRQMCGRGKTEYWDSIYKTPEPGDLLLPDLLDRLPADAGHGAAVAAIAEAIAICRGLNHLRYSIVDRKKHREWELNKVRLKDAIAKYQETNPGWTVPEYEYVDLPELRDQLHGFTQRLSVLTTGIVKETSRPDELQRIVTNEARTVLRDWEIDYEGCSPHQAWSMD